ncbi:hypothetical protein KL919_003024 [Ogataea angusta]|nr:hypothetical protein KL919_003024 [Ogataea angusta]
MIRSSQRRERFWAFAGLLKGGKGPCSVQERDCGLCKTRNAPGWISWYHVLPAFWSLGSACLPSQRRCTRTCTAPSEIDAPTPKFPSVDRPVHLTIFFLNFVKYHWLNKPKNTTMPNRVIELQKFYQSTNKPIYMAHPRSKYYLIPYALGLTLSVGASLYYTGRACFGLKAGQ